MLSELTLQTYYFTPEELKTLKTLPQRVGGRALP
jgi:hypothetical protein